MASDRELHFASDHKTITFGTLYGGADIARAAWPHASQSFSVNDSESNPDWSDILPHRPVVDCAGTRVDRLPRHFLDDHAAKLERPTQTPKYCGFLYDHTGIPKKKIPPRKRARAISCIRYVRSSTMGARTSRLAWAGLVGLLQSLVPATPSRIGASFLRGCYDDLYEIREGDLDPTHMWFFLQDMMVSNDSWRSIDWWEQVLLADIACPARPSDCATLAVTWGDGSGTGTGYTEQLLSGKGPCPPMQMTMGTWSTQVHSFSSNWKELRTLKLVLEKDLPKRHFYRRLLFYFTDNIVTYFVICNGTSSSPTLMDLARDIKRMEMTLECHLVAVHVPGTLMILQCMSIMYPLLDALKIAIPQQGSLGWESLP